MSAKEQSNDVANANDEETSSIKLTIKSAAAKRHREESVNTKEQSNDVASANDKDDS